MPPMLQELHATNLAPDSPNASGTGAIPMLVPNTPYKSGPGLVQGFRNWGAPVSGNLAPRPMFFLFVYSAAAEGLFFPMCGTYCFLIFPIIFRFSSAERRHAKTLEIFREF